MGSGSSKVNNTSNAAAAATTAGKPLVLQLPQSNAAAEAAAGPRDEDGNTKLHLAARAGDVRAAAALLADGADVNVRNNRQQTPLHLAAEAGRIETVWQVAQVAHPAVHCCVSCSSAAACTHVSASSCC
jgi:ankyrin repeat protein